MALSTLSNIHQNNFTSLISSRVTFSYTGSYTQGTYGVYTYYILTTNGTLDLSLTGSSKTINYYLVGGGGSGGFNGAGQLIGGSYKYGLPGNGGNGGQVVTSSFDITSTNTYSVTIGQGGVARDFTTVPGDSTSLGGISAYGGNGGRGGLNNQSPSTSTAVNPANVAQTGCALGGLGTASGTGIAAAGDGTLCPPNGIYYGGGGGGGGNPGYGAAAGIYGGGFKTNGIANSGGGGGANKTVVQNTNRVKGYNGGSGLVVIWF